MEDLCDVLVESVLEGFGEGFCQLLRELREVRTLERIGFLLLEGCNIIDSALEVDNKIGFVVIDGIRDLINDINSPGESVEIINDLMRWTNMYNIHIHTVLHLNKSDDNTRGHIGTELNNKAETVMKIIKSELNPEVSEVRPMITREKEFSNFAFRINEDGVPEDIPGFCSDEEERVTFENITVPQHKEILDKVFAGGTVKGYNTLVARLREQYAETGYKRGRTSFVMWLKHLMAKGIVVKDGREYRYDRDKLTDLRN